MAQVCKWLFDLFRCSSLINQDYIGRWSTSFQYCRIVLPYICSINLEIFTRQTGGCLFSLFSVRYRSTRCRWNVSSFFEKTSKTLSSSQLTRWLLALHASKQDFVFCAHSQFLLLCQLASAQDMYHLVSAVVLGFTTSIFTEGRIWGASPPCYIAIYFMTIGPLFQRIGRSVHALKEEVTGDKRSSVSKFLPVSATIQVKQLKMQSISIVYV